MMTKQLTTEQIEFTPEQLAAVDYARDAFDNAQAVAEEYDPVFVRPIMALIEAHIAAHDPDGRLMDYCFNDNFGRGVSDG